MLSWPPTIKYNLTLLTYESFYFVIGQNLRPLGILRAIHCVRQMYDEIKQTFNMENIDILCIIHALYEVRAIQSSISRL